MSIKLIAIDVDGTLVSGFNTPVPPKNREAIAQAVEKGITVCLLSGRMMTSLEAAAAETAANGPLAACNGAFITWGDRTLYYKTIPQDLLLDCVRAVWQQRIYFHVWAKYEGFCPARDFKKAHYESMNRPIPDERKVSMTTFHDPEALVRTVGNRGLKLTVYENDPGKKDAMRAILRETLHRRGALTHSEPDNLEVTAKHVNKGEALKRMAAACGAEHDEILAIGNSYNDIPMFELAGQSAAMADADDAVKAAAAHTVPRWDEDGVAEAFFKWAL
jgi:Cof subfamily protein (haloacid dehalogenase superfamily)